MKQLVPFVLVALLVVSLPAGVASAAGVGPGYGGTGDRAGSSVHAEGIASSHVASGSGLEPTLLRGPDVPVASTTTGSSEDVLHRTTTLRHLPDRPGEFETEKTFDVPGAVVGFEVDLGSRADVVALDGFEETADGTYRWDEESEEPSIRFGMPADRVGGGHGDHDGYAFLDTGEWAVVQVPGISVSVRQTSSVGFEETVVVDGPGATGGDIAFFGPVTEYERSVGGETIRLVVPEAAEEDLVDDPGEILETLAWASQRLDVGERSGEVFVVAVPAHDDWGPQGVHYGDGNVWVGADNALAEAGNVWLHEYVHVRQGYRGEDVGVTDETRWLVEAQADYYAATLAFEKGLIDFEEYSRFLSVGERAPFSDAVLTEPDTWDDEYTEYAKGRLVYGEIDRQLRLSTHGDRTAEDVFRVINAGEGTLDGEAYMVVLEQAGGEDVRAIAERYVETSATPEMWSQHEHGEAFDLQGVTFAYELERDALEGESRAWEFLEDEGNEAVTAVPVDESVTVDVAVQNVGDRDGTADATLAVDGRVVDYAQPTLEAGAETTETLEWTPTEPGVYDLRVGDERVTVFVRSGASVTSSVLGIEPTTVAPGEPVTAQATLENVGDDPAAAIVLFRTHEGVVAEHPVLLAGGESTTLEQELVFDGEGEYEVAVGTQGGESDDRSATVVVEDSPVPGVDGVSGFGVAGALVALLVGLSVALLGQGSRGRR
ncbi:CARDB domain-containing protein [Natrarchaeobaculum aegyptiacum]|uniref:CARDB domain-containing protein n=1 Tax=Natrarchaeobaculum aegyptiacum TaxID=745377 RepID=A0A2Z2HT74_9EURY|nr:CARDB domain-containing protein [Natrarchaeobaculum aegyptiacum]ARS89315.1 hypothetical protein B1756_05850 [Natrarchaeobaculum aegyptiacum]